MSDSSRSGDADCNTGDETRLKSQRKRKKYVCNYRTEWETEFTWLKSDESNKNKALCTLCKKSFKVANGGLNDVKQHDKGAEHKKNIRIKQSSASITNFFGKPSTSSQHSKKVAAAELGEVYHNVMHAHSYRSLDCTTKLAPLLYCDSKIASDLQLGRTKAANIVTGVLAPYSIQPKVKKLVDSGQYYSIATDASNHGNIKMYPLVIRYYTLEEGVNEYLLDYYEDAKERSNDIFIKIKDKLLENNLDIQNISSYAADNANVNFGRFNSVFTRLKTENSNILEARCSAHIVHNCAKFALDKMTFDVEVMVTKIINYFASYAKRTEELKGFFEFIDLEYKPLKRHVTTRWLSLHPAMGRLLKNFPAVKSYFISLPDNDRPIHIMKFLEKTIPIDTENSEETITEAELHLYFFDNVLTIFNNTVLELEGANVSICSVYEIMDGLRKKLQQRVKDNFYGMHINQILRKLPSRESDVIKQTFLTWYMNAIQYLESRFDFSENNYLHSLLPLNLKQELSFGELQAIVTRLNIFKVNLDDLYEEFCAISPLINKYVQEKPAGEIASPNIWTKLIKACKDSSSMKNFIHILQLVLSIPASNAPVERIFSLCGNAWTDSRNRLNIDTIKAELQVKCNFKLTCKDFYTFASQNEDLLKAVSSDKKYKFKN